MKVSTSIPRMQADQHGFKHSELSEFKRYVFENDRKIRVNLCESAEKK